MGLADYYSRGALAASQVLNGFDEARFRARLEETAIGIAFTDDVVAPEGEALVELLVRLLARLYPRLALVGPAVAVDRFSELAQRINPLVDIERDARLGVAVGEIKKPFERTVYTGSSGWDALVSST